MIEEFDPDTETVIQMASKNRMQKDEEERKKINKEKIKRKKKHKKIKFITKIIIFILLMAGGIIFALVSPIFNIQEIDVINNSNVPSDTIISLSGLSKDTNMFKFLKLVVENKIKENPYIEDVKIRRKMPNTIEIEVTERTPEYSIQVLESYAYINEQGYILEVLPENKGLPIIIGVKTPEEDLIAGNRLNEDDLEKLEDVIRIKNLAKKYEINEMITSIDISDKNEYSIYLEQANKTIHLGNNTNLSDKMLYAVTIMKEEEGKAGDVFVNGDLNSKFQPYFREKV